MLDRESETPNAEPYSRENAAIFLAAQLSANVGQVFNNAQHLAQNLQNQSGDVVILSLVLLGSVLAMVSTAEKIKSLHSQHSS